MEFDVSMLATPAVIAALIAVVRQFTDTLDGPKAYWVSLVFNIVGTVLLAVATSGEADPNLVGAATNGLIGGAVLTPGIVGTTKRVGLGGVMKPRQGGAT